MDQPCPPCQVPPVGAQIRYEVWVPSLDHPRECLRRLRLGGEDGDKEEHFKWHAAAGRPPSQIWVVKAERHCPLQWRGRLSCHREGRVGGIRLSGNAQGPEVNVRNSHLHRRNHGTITGKPPRVGESEAHRRGRSVDAGEGEGRQCSSCTRSRVHSTRQTSSPSTSRRPNSPAASMA